MNFMLTEEQSLLRDMVRSFAESEVAVSAAQRDEEERFDRALMFDRLGELGLTGRCARFTPWRSDSEPSWRGRKSGVFLGVRANRRRRSLR